MYKRSIYLVIALSLVYMPGSKAQTNTKMENNFNGEQKKVLSTIEKMVHAFHNKDINGVLSCYELDATILFEPQKPITGREMLKNAFSSAFEINPKYEFGAHEIYITGNIATHITPWAMKGQLPDGTLLEQSGLSVAVLRKQNDGNWLMVLDNPHGQFLMDKQ